MINGKTVIDVDAHFMEPIDWVMDVDPGIAEHIDLQEVYGNYAEILLRELLDSFPPDHRPKALDVVKNFMPPEAHRDLAGLRRLADESKDWDEMRARINENPVVGMFSLVNSMEPRVQYLDEHHIDIQVVNPSHGPTLADTEGLSRELRERALSAYNTWTVEQCRGFTDRFSPTIFIDFENPEWAVRELERAREGGSRSFEFPIAPTASGISLTHPDLYPVWDTAAEAGMLAVMHIGQGAPEVNGDWANNGSNNPMETSFLWWSVQGMVPRVALTAMIRDGIFERFPKLQVCTQEFVLEWVGGWVDLLDGMIASRTLSQMLGGWKLPMKPSEYAKRNVRVSPLPQGGEGLLHTLETIPPEMLAFCSDWPHPEGSQDAVGYYETLFAEHPAFPAAEVAAPFYGENVLATVGVR
jgi:uncharacterized protein